MCVEIIYLKNQGLLDQSMERQLMQLVDAEKQKKLNRFHFARDMQNGLLGELLVRYMVGRRLGIKLHEITFTYGAYQKPYILGQDIYFNLSHSDTVIAAVVGTQEVGIDVEIIKEVDLKIAERFFTKNEYASIKNYSGRKEEQFYKIWTRKESFIKNIGTGLHMPLNQFEVLEDVIAYEGRSYYLQDLKVVDGYASAVCLCKEAKVHTACYCASEFANWIL